MIGPFPNIIYKNLLQINKNKIENPFLKNGQKIW